MFPHEAHSRSGCARLRQTRSACAAKGRDELADAIIAEAKKQGVYIAQDRELVAALSRLDLEQEIPRELYVAVAVVLSWAYWLQGMKPGDEKI